MHAVFEGGNHVRMHYCKIKGEWGYEDGIWEQLYHSPLFSIEYTCSFGDRILEIRCKNFFEIKKR